MVRSMREHHVPKKRQPDPVGVVQNLDQNDNPGDVHPHSVFDIGSTTPDTDPPEGHQCKRGEEKAHDN